MKNKHFYAYKFIFFISISYINQAQEIDFDDFSLGFAVQSYETNSDLEKYWSAGLGAGIAVKYKVRKNLYLEGNLILSKFSSNNMEFADFILVSAPAGIHYKFFPEKNFNSGIFFGLENNSFIFTGEASDKISENDIESEFGIFGGISFSFLISSKIETEAFYKIQNIFSSPEELVIQNIGLKIFFRNLF